MALNPKTALGCQTDCERLIDNFAKNSRSFTFEDFSKEWRKLHFTLIFCGREPRFEQPEFTRELFNIAKSCLLNAPSFGRKIGCLYLIYGLYFNQKTNCKFRVTYNDLKSLNEFMNEIRLEGNKEAEYIFYKLFVNNAFIFCATSSEHVYCSSSRSEDVEMDFTSEPQSDLLELLNSDTLDQLGALHSRYQEIKIAISDPESQDSSLKTIKDNHVNEVAAQITALKKNLERSRGIKPAKVNYRKMDESDGSSSEFNDTEEEEEDQDIGERRRRLKAQFFQSADDTYRLPGASRTTTRIRRKRKTAE